jgi:hypothetical protein
MTKEELEKIIPQIYFYCENKDPNGFYPTEEIDLLEFSHKLLAVIEAKAPK